MTKKELFLKVQESGDAVVSYRSVNSKKLKYNVVTTDFYNEYIKTKTLKVTDDDDTLLVFSWDSDSFKLLKPALVTSVVPLSNMLKNER